MYSDAVVYAPLVSSGDPFEEHNHLSMSTPLLFNASTPLNRLPPGASPAQSVAGTSTTGTQLSAPETLSRACKRLLDPNSDLSLGKLQEELGVLGQSVQNAFHEPQSTFDG